MADAGLLQGLVAALSLTNLGYALIGCLLGMLVGILPGLGPAAALAILLPITIYMPPTGSVIIMAGVYYGAMYAGSTTAILMNIPGEVASVVTAIDGYQMTRNGRAGEALAIAAMGSFTAGILGTVLIAWIGPPLAEVALSFGPPEYFGLVLFSLTALVGFAGRSLLLGVAMALAGVWLATIGSDPLTGTQRLSFDSVTMMKGFDIVPVTVGLFGIGEVLYNARLRMGHIFEGTLPSWLRMLPRGIQLARGMAASVRGTLVGGVMGLLPGMVPALTAYVAYDVERRVAKHGKELGSGAIEGVASPEAANNATAMTGFIPLLSLGIPTSPALAIVLGTLIMNGLQPGPQLFVKNGDFVFTVIGAMLVGNAIMLVLSLPLVRFWARISVVPYRVLGPIILVICIVGAFAPRNAISDVFVALLFGAIGYLMRRLDWPMSPLILGFLLGPLFEQSFRQSMGISNGDLAIFVQRPIPLLCIIAAALVVVVTTWLKRRSGMLSRLVVESANEV